MKIMDYRSIFGLILLALMANCATFMDESDMKGKTSIQLFTTLNEWNDTNCQSNILSISGAFTIS